MQPNWKPLRSPNSVTLAGVPLTKGMPVVSFKIFYRRLQMIQRSSVFWFLLVAVASLSACKIVENPSEAEVTEANMTDAERKRWKKAFNKYAIKEAEDDKKKGSSTRAPPKKKAPPVDEDEALKMKTEHIQNALWMADCNPLKEV